MLSYSRRVLLLTTMLAFLCGCSGQGTYEVSGSVTYDGQPVEKGEISFVPLEAGAAPDAGLIENGQFSFRAKPGKKRVIIRGSRRLPEDRQTNPEMGILYDDYIPSVYNDESELTAEVGAGGDKPFEFELTIP